MLYDITLPITSSLAAWPGDIPFHFELNWKIGEKKSPVNVGAVTMGVHTGTHTDAPFHFSASGAGAGEMDLAPFIGQAVVVETQTRIIGWDVFQNVDFSQTSRVLVKTGAWPDTSRFPHFVPVLAPDVPARLAENGVVLFGVDVPSVDELDSKTMPIHHALHAVNIAILEGLALDAVPPGVYHLTALPLRIMGADGAPVRAVLYSE